MAERAVASRRSLEVEFFRMLNRVVEPIMRRGEWIDRMLNLEDSNER